MKHRGFFHWIGVLALVCVVAWGMSSVVDAGGGRCGGSCGGQGDGHGGGHGGKGGLMAGPMAGPMGHMRVLAGSLELTEDQVAAIHGIIEKNEDQIRPAMKALMQKNVALHQAVLSGQGDEATIRALADEVGKALGDSAVVGSAIAGEARTVLTAEQLERLDGILAKHTGCSGDCGDDCSGDCGGDCSGDCGGDCSGDCHH